MKNNLSFRTLFPYLIAILVFLVATFLYLSPLLNGQELSMHDDNMVTGAAKELKDFHDKTGEWAWWTNSMFGGMPAYMIVGGYSYSLTSMLGGNLYGLLPIPANVFFLLMLVFYVFMKVLKVNNWLSITASIGYAFSTYNLVFIEAGHISKILALAYLPGLMAGFILVFRRKYLWGTFLTALFLGLELYANHLQITYYFIFVLLAYSIFELVKLIKEKDFGSISKMALSFLVAVFLGVGMHTQRLWSNIVYSAETTRGKSELKQSSVGSTGLDRDYAFAWSYGVNETLNLIVPNLMGGSSSGALDENSATFNQLVKSGVDRGNAKMFVSNLPLYHGQQSVTAGPAYIGIIIAFLFVFGLFIRADKSRWLLLGVLIFLIMLSWGSNFSVLNYFMYDYVPGYNKFRAVSIILTIAHFILVWGAALAANELLEKKMTFERIKKPLIYSFSTLLVLMIIGYFSVNFVGLNDTGLLNSLKGSLGDSLANQLLNALRDDRADMALADIYRGIVLMVLVSGLIFFAAKGKLKPAVFGIALLLLVTFDLFSVGKRYFNNDDFQRKMGNKKAVFQPTAADLQILQDKDLDYRVLNLTVSFMNDARDSYFHKSLGGYHGAKLKKYQELVEYQMLKDGSLNMGIINMLNTKYFISGNENGVQAQMNANALGNAWFVENLNVVPNADEELAATGTLNAGYEAVTQAKYMSASKNYQTDSTASIKLISYAPNKLVYESNSSQEGFGVFSEIYYRGNVDWISAIDGKEADHIPVDYVLRGMEIPAGKHEIVFEFKPASVSKGKIGDLIASIGLVLLFAVSLYSFKKKDDFPT